REETAQVRPARIPAGCAPLADPARALRLHRARTEMPRVPDPRSLLVSREDRLMFAPSRDEARKFLTDAWAKYRAGAPLSPLEQQACGIIAPHPEYHAVMEQPERHLERDYSPEG